MAAMEMFEEHEGTHILQSLDGFAISLNSDGRFLYISETVSIYLGLSQVSNNKYNTRNSENNTIATIYFQWRYIGLNIVENKPNSWFLFNYYMIIWR